MDLAIYQRCLQDALEVIISYERDIKVAVGRDDWHEVQRKIDARGRQSGIVSGMRRVGRKQIDNPDLEDTIYAEALAWARMEGEGD